MRQMKTKIINSIIKNLDALSNKKNTRACICQREEDRRREKLSKERGEKEGRWGKEARDRKKYREKCRQTERGRLGDK